MDCGNTVGHREANKGHISALSCTEAADNSSRIGRTQIKNKNKIALVTILIDKKTLRLPIIIIFRFAVYADVVADKDTITRYRTAAAARRFDFKPLILHMFIIIFLSRGK